MREYPRRLLGSIGLADACDAYVADSDGEWVAFRAEGVGGSDVAAVMGANGYRTPLEVWMEKVGRAAPQDLSGKEAVEWGNRLESVIRQKFSEAHPELRVRALNCTLVPKARPWAHANLDGTVRDADGRMGVLEVKTVGFMRAGDWDDGVPDYYVAQVTHYLSVTGWSYAYVVALVGGQRYMEFRIDRDEGDIAAVDATVDAFWHDYVEAGVMPAVTSGDAKALRALHPSGDGESLVPAAGQAEFDRLVADRERARRDESEAAERRRLLDNRIREAIGDLRSLSSDVYRVSWSRGTQRRLDARALRRDHPDIYEAYCRESPRDGGIRVTERG